MQYRVEFKFINTNVSFYSEWFDDLRDVGNFILAAESGKAFVRAVMDSNGENVDAVRIPNLH